GPDDAEMPVAHQLKLASPAADVAILHREVEEEPSIRAQGRANVVEGGAERVCILDVRQAIEGADRSIEQSRKCEAAYIGANELRTWRRAARQQQHGFRGIHAGHAEAKLQQRARELSGAAASVEYARPGGQVVQEQTPNRGQGPAREVFRHRLAVYAGERIVPGWLVLAFGSGTRGHSSKQMSRDTRGFCGREDFSSPLL